MNMGMAELREKKINKYLGTNETNGTNQMLYIK